MNTKEKIIHTSISLFNEFGERSISTNHIASHLGMSPGNLYYHFKNKEDIIRHIFALYRDHLNTHFKPINTDDDAFLHLSDYLDSLFELMWRFHFFYDNLGVILARDSQLKQDYIDFQSVLLGQVQRIVIGLRDSGMINIDEQDTIELAHTLKLTVSFWTPYVKARRVSGELAKEDIYRGILKVLALFKAYSTEKSLVKMNVLRDKYSQLAKHAPNDDE
ncbi:TetR/AcrR family transcriptional regulator [Pseudoalteromonas sp. MMG010]|uniref:TetR/AcrR family transcriptional regulator n=1 Tax=Pseudoalteromonas sp. MMG010 TaxID=2822685 RepID=UPI001B39E6F2|nr:TetR/AcrR family transcriptional regulator [Pseudoalteromonas sp. MMG010]MBQ4833984.1 TetR/AcrR family transcriptional regulator [Pseudoalteromonas sp. MMG010]